MKADLDCSHLPAWSMPNGVAKVYGIALDT